MEEFSKEEIAVLEEAHVRGSQLRNLRKIILSPIPKKKLKYLTDKVLPGYVTRELNARHQAEKLMKKKGYHAK